MLFSPVPWSLFICLRASAPYADDVAAERIVERRYYVKKSKSLSKSDQLTSTSDLSRYLHHHGRKHRQHSGVSSTNEGSGSSCSGCSSSASNPSYVEQLRQQSDSLKEEIRNLKSEIEHLHVSQDKFFAQFKSQLPAKPESRRSSQSSGKIVSIGV